jgi:hypothetical protein
MNAGPESKNVLTEMPSSTDNNAYAIVYLTAKHGTSNTTAFDYGKGMEMTATAEDLLKGSFSKKGDNMQWEALFWKFAVGGITCLVKILIDSKTRKAGATTFILPKEPVKFPNGGVLDSRYLEKLPSYPFNNNGLRPFDELERDGQLAIIDVSDNNGVDTKSKEVLEHMMVSDGISGFMDGEGADFGKYPNVRYLGVNDLLTRPDGMADMAASKKVSEILKNADKETPVTTPTTAPAPEEDKDKRFAAGMALTDLEDTDSALSKIKTNLEKIEPTAVKLFGEASTKTASLHRVVMDFYIKKANTLTKKLS